VAVSLFPLIAITWVVLAIAVGFHAKGHNRSGIIWFVATIITGIFGLGFYLLAITSNSPTNGQNEGQRRGQSTDAIIIKSIPLVVIGIIGGLVVGVIAMGMMNEISTKILSGNTTVDDFFPILALSVVTGSVLGPYLWNKQQKKSPRQAR